MRPGIYLALAVLYFSSCLGSGASNKTNYFKNNGLTLMGSTFQNPIPGPAGAGSTEYFFKISVVTKEVVSFDSVWIGQKALPVFISKEKNTVTSGEVKIAMGSTIMLRASDLNSLQTPISSKAPVAYEGPALIRYLLSGTPYYLRAQEIKLVSTQKEP